MSNMIAFQSMMGIQDNEIKGSKCSNSVCLASKEDLDDVKTSSASVFHTLLSLRCVTYLTSAALGCKVVTPDNTETVSVHIGGSSSECGMFPSHSLVSFFSVSVPDLFLC